MPIYRGSGGAGDSTTDATVTEVTQQAINAANSATQAATSASNAATSANNASTSATAASTSATNAASSASSASTSASNASTSATASASSATSAATSASAASTSATAAQTAETNAETAETNAESAQAYAEEWATKAEDSLISTAAGGDGSTDYSALHHAAKAATSETNAATSETNASNSATSASNSATASANSATAAATSATSASTSASAAATSATSAASSAASAASALDNFDDRYLGSYASDPATDNDGDPLVVGALYFNSTDGVMKVYTASGWIAASSASVATMTKFNFTATGGQTVFSGADDNTETLSLTVGAEMVTLNGVVLEQGTDYTATSSAITLTTGATASDELNVYAFGNFQVADTVSASTGGTFTGAVTFDGGVSTSADITFGDNDKALFGAGSDLQIYHDGSNSYISDQGTGNLKIIAQEFVVLNSANSEAIIRGFNDGAVELYYDAGKKLATTSTGIDVTGTVTADDIILSDANPTVRMFETDATDLNTNMVGVAGALYVQTVNDAASALTNRIKVDHATGDISFYEDTGTTPKLFWDASAERLGIGTTNPVRQLQIGNNTGANDILSLQSDPTGQGSIMFGDDQTTAAEYRGMIRYNHPSDAMQFWTSSTERMRIDSSGNVGIGTSSPSATLDTYIGAGLTTFGDFANSVRVQGGNNTGKYVPITFGGYGSYAPASIAYLVTTGTGNTKGDLVFGTRNVTTDTRPTERMRITANGGITWGSPSETRDSCIFWNYGQAALDVRRYADSGDCMIFKNSGTLSGTISVSGASCSYNTSSDYRLKENVIDLTGSIDRLKQLPVHQFNFIGEENTVDGFLAHEAQAIVPEAVTGTKDAVDADGNPDYQGIDQSKLVPLLTGALQEAITKIETLETTQADLLARIETLEGN